SDLKGPAVRGRERPGEAVPALGYVATSAPPRWRQRSPQPAGSAESAGKALRPCSEGWRWPQGRAGSRPAGEEGHAATESVTFQETRVVNLTPRFSEDEFGAERRLVLLEPSRTPDLMLCLRPKGLGVATQVPRRSTVGFQIRHRVSNRQHVTVE